VDTDAEMKVVYNAMSDGGAIKEMVGKQGGPPEPERFPASRVRRYG
jgi:hypothetical protein